VFGSVCQREGLCVIVCERECVKDKVCVCERICVIEFVS
jgi:hypothetical protein